MKKFMELSKDIFLKLVDLTRVKIPDPVIYILITYLLIQLICGISYNVFCKNDINTKIENMSAVVLNMEPVKQYKINEFKVRKTRAFIARTIETTFETKKEPQIAFQEMLLYLKNTDWIIKKTNNLYLEVEKNKYVVDISFYKNKHNITEGNITVHQDDFFYRHSW